MALELNRGREKERAANEIGTRGNDELDSQSMHIHGHRGGPHFSIAQQTLYGIRNRNHKYNLFHSMHCGTV